jgi:RNA-directed DNA polymerase
VITIPKKKVCNFVGGELSPLLANIYLHEFDVYMRKYTALNEWYRKKRRVQGLSNFVYVRYADDWVILCNGTRAQAEEMKGEVYDFLKSELNLTLSLEKTKITHITEGFKFLVQPGGKKNPFWVRPDGYIMTPCT